MTRDSKKRATAIRVVRTPPHPGAGRSALTRRQRSAEIRAAILERARALYAAGGYAAVTMRDIANELGLKAPSLYHHFLSKEEIFLALQERTLRLQVEQVTRFGPPLADPVADLRRLYWLYYEFSKTHPDYFSLLYADRSAPALDAALYRSPSMQHLRMLAKNKIQRCVDAGVFPRGTNRLEKAAAVLWAAVHGIAVLRLMHEPRTRESAPMRPLAVEAWLIPAAMSDADRAARWSLDFAIEGIRSGALARATRANRARSKARRG